MNIDPAQTHLLQNLIDRQALLDLVARYCVAVDRHEYEILRELYHEDAYDDHGDFNRGSVDTLIEALRAAAPYTPVLQHHVTTTDFAIDGCRAEGEIYVLAFHTVSGPGNGAGTDMLIGGRYLDKYERRDGRWKFLRRSIVTDWAQIQDSDGASHPMVPKGPVGTPDRDDPSFAYFDLLR